MPVKIFASKNSLLALAFLSSKYFKKKPKKVGENVIIIGGPYVENGWIDHDQYISLIYKIKFIFIHQCDQISSLKSAKSKSTLVLRNFKTSLYNSIRFSLTNISFKDL